MTRILVYVLIGLIAALLPGEAWIIIGLGVLALLALTGLWAWLMILRGMVLAAREARRSAVPEPRIFAQRETVETNSLAMEE
jgi:hypothetical protein